ncbi:hypothetical protein [Ramlibacter sp. WS9]|uniref:hypothetical protein n=1 Tax=Ramlibacter sp. WS9 TaxID=1882741 RepID=UPI0011438EE6|nr:hypothetical protein [Ramlibacter sp. WS9]ROZ78144.1 hypothetical protein EEB15_06770 [Ramlibacter sp. WS9]
MDSMDIKNWAVAGAARFESVWDFTDYWKRSNTFHGFLRFVDAAAERWGDDPALVPMKNLRTAMIATNLSFFPEQMHDPKSIWADDYGWCGISCLAARDHLLSINDQALGKRYLDIATECWQRMRDVGYDDTNSATPVRSGCGNVPPDRKSPGYFGTRNTVTNVNLLLLSLRLYTVTKEAKYLSMAFAQYLWFATWFNIKYESLDAGRYMKAYSRKTDCLLIHERPRANKSYTQVNYPDWGTGWVWSGDQGLTMMAMAELFLMRGEFAGLPGFDPELVQRICLFIGNGAADLLFSKMDGVLREAPYDSSFNFDPADYVGGRGVMLRYATEAAVQQVIGKSFCPDGVKATAAAVWNSRDASNQFASLWNPKGDASFNKYFVETWGSGDANISSWALDLSDHYGVLQALGLDALTAAIRLR